MRRRLRWFAVPPVLGGYARASAGLALIGAVSLPLGAQSVATLLSRGDSLWGVGMADSAAAAYRRALALDSTASPRAVMRVGNTAAWGGHTDSALALYGRYERMEPRDPLGPFARARAQAWASRFVLSLATLDSLSVAQPGDRDVALLHALVLAWSGDLTGSAARSRQWLQAHADDDEGRAALAKTLVWGGRFDEAEREYRALGMRVPAEAAKGLARVAASRGDIEGARERWLEATKADPRDAETWTGLAQVQRWLGRSREAEASLLQALAVSPGYADAIAQRVWVSAELSPAVDPLLALTNDSDKNVVNTFALTGSFTPDWQGRGYGVAQLRTAELGAISATSVGLRGGVTWAPDRRGVSFRAEVGVAFLSKSIALGGPASGEPGAQLAYLLRAAAPLAPRLTGWVAVAGGAFDETAVLIARGIRTDGIEGELSVALPSSVALSAGAAWARIGNGTVKNAKLTVIGSARYVLRRGTWLGAMVRSFGHDTLASADGYFSPQRYTLAEAVAHFELPKDIGWNVSAEAGLGTQWIRRDAASAESSESAQRASLAVVNRPRPGTEVSVGLWIANVASPFSNVATTGYRAGGLTARARVAF